MFFFIIKHTGLGPDVIFCFFCASAFCVLGAAELRDPVVLFMRACANRSADFSIFHQPGGRGARCSELGARGSELVVGATLRDDKDFYRFIKF